jgi:hypothetical protein
VAPDEQGDDVIRAAAAFQPVLWQRRFGEELHDARHLPPETGGSRSLKVFTLKSNFDNLRLFHLTTSVQIPY